MKIFLPYLIAFAQLEQEIACLFSALVPQSFKLVHVRVTRITALKRTYLCHNTTCDHQQWTDSNDNKSKLPAIHKTDYKTHKNYCDGLKEHANFCTNTIIYFVQVSVQKQKKKENENAI